LQTCRKRRLLSICIDSKCDKSLIPDQALAPTWSLNCHPLSYPAVCYIKETDVGSRPVSSPRNDTIYIQTCDHRRVSQLAGIGQIVRELKGDMKLSITISSQPRFVASDLHRGVG
jgi:hypothetical protein